MMIVGKRQTPKAKGPKVIKAPEELICEMCAGTIKVRQATMMIKGKPRHAYLNSCRSA